MKIKLTHEEKWTLMQGHDTKKYVFHTKYVWGSTERRTKWAIVFFSKNLTYQWTYDEHENGTIDMSYDEAHRVRRETRTITEWKAV